MEKNDSRARNLARPYETRLAEFIARWKNGGNTDPLGLRSWYAGQGHNRPLPIWGILEYFSPYEDLPVVMAGSIEAIEKRARFNGGITRLGMRVFERWCRRYRISCGHPQAWKKFLLETKVLDRIMRKWGIQGARWHIHRQVYDTVSMQRVLVRGNEIDLYCLSEQCAQALFELGEMLAIVDGVKNPSKRTYWR